ncbi:winged helix family transcriptional regulator [Streptomyces finlayi]|uniref:Winged helix family transcriptional regulator n=1 Tax=Streptomyces finlayi TaxID=67296 RepID=A0A7G7BR48_9ACTN|nr:winged helix-turn-helix domain-containing protein [Streptomyces finlayi]QNE77813.1 winged helix family transcriptional regulator [Streptomyces finlayi]
MANTRTLSAASSAPAAATSTVRPFSSPRHRLRSVDPDEIVQFSDLAGLLPPGATWLPAPQHSLPTLPGQPPMIGYLVLVPADPQPDAEGPGSGPVRIDSARRTAAVDGVPLDLTYLEFELLAHLVAHPHRVHTRDQLVTTVWGYGHVGDGRTVDVHVARLRRKLGAEHRGTIRTVRRVGYTYAP